MGPTPPHLKTCRTLFLSFSSPLQPTIVRPPKQTNILISSPTNLPHPTSSPLHFIHQFSLLPPPSLSLEMKPHSGRFLQDVLSPSRTFAEDPPSDAASSSSSPLNKAAFRHNPASFDSSMGLTALVLLSALFFMGFFSIYIRRCAEDSNAAAAAFLRRRHPPRTYSSSLPWLSSSAKGGLDPSTVQSLPLISYDGDAKHPIDCVICLSEFEEGETVKLIPSCSHVFHPQCIDTWLSSHVSCPLCRCTQMFAAAEVRIRVTQGEDNHQEGSTVDNHNTTEEVGPVETRRSWSCSNLSLLGDQMAILQRSLSL